jgi:D-glycero-beta-D-manno-heptose-7-phosphate kinase
LKTSFSIEKIELDNTRKAQILKKIPQMAEKKILVVGDVGLDEYIIGAVKRISPEAPVPVMDVESEEKRLGLSANVAQNITSLGAKVGILSVVGDDFGAELLKPLFKEANIPWDLIQVDTSRPTTRKSRVMAGPHHIVRIDYELKKYLSETMSSRLFKAYCESITGYDGVILQDYAKGIFDEALIQKFIAEANRLKIPVFVDPHRTQPLVFYRGASLFKPNYDESLVLAGLNFEDLRENPNKVYEIGQTLQKKLNTKDIVITRGKEGMTIFSGERITEVPTFAKRVFDVTGAGDTVIATIALSQVAGFSLNESCLLANVAAGNVVSKVGCVPCDLKEMVEFISH